MDVVNESYDAVKTKFAQMPDENIQANEDNTHNVVKNFGLSAWNDSQTEDDFDLDATQEKAFEGTVADEREARR